MPPLVQEATNYNLRNSNNMRNFNRNGQIPPKYFNAGSRMGQTLHARLRMECSSLNFHLYRKNIVPNPSCSCGGFESSYHFFFTCPKYSRIRNSYLPHNLHTFHTEHSLHGRDDLSNTENEQLFLQVQEFILQTKLYVVCNQCTMAPEKKKQQQKTCCTYLYRPVFVAVLVGLGRRQVIYFLTVKLYSL